MDRVCLVIPARFRSTRFPGKPLALISGVSLIERTWRACMASRFAFEGNVFIATDDNRIADFVRAFTDNILMTSESCMTGTDRIAEAASNLDYDLIINVQGDEPMVSGRDIDSVIERAIEDPSQVYCGYAPINEMEVAESFNVPKVVVNEAQRMVYMSRAVVPAAKTSRVPKARQLFRQVCIYAFSQQHLQFFADYGRKSKVEEVEDIEILRFLESDFSVQMVEVRGESIAVDVPEDILAVEKLLLNKGEVS